MYLQVRLSHLIMYKQGNYLYVAQFSATFVHLVLQGLWGLQTLFIFCSVEVWPPSQGSRFWRIICNFSPNAGVDRGHYGVMLWKSCFWNIYTVRMRQLLGWILCSCRCRGDIYNAYSRFNQKPRVDRQLPSPESLQSVRDISLILFRTALIWAMSLPGIRYNQAVCLALWQSVTS